MTSFSVIYDCTDFVVVDKSAGVDFHDCDGLAGLFSQVKSSLGLTEFYPVHRLDKVTSGLVVFAKTAAVNKALCQQFFERTTEKYYVAIAAGKPKKKQGAVTGDMARSRRSSWVLLKTKNNPALTQFFSYSLIPGLRMYLLKPATGKTHQLRVALKSVAAPILGDKIYSGANTYKIEEQNHTADRTYLHAYSLGFTLFGRDYRFVCKPSQGELFVQANDLLARLEEPWCLPWPNLDTRG